MKKLFFVFAVATSLVACNNAAETSATNSVDSARIADSIKAATPVVVDTTTKVDTTVIKVDTSAKKVDTTKKM